MTSFWSMRSLRCRTHARISPARSTSRSSGWTSERRAGFPSSTREIVVYCIDATCTSSVLVARRLRSLGYTNVRHYLEGKADWTEAGLPLEGGAMIQS